jgi:hypothetical protein
MEVKEIMRIIGMREGEMYRVFKPLIGILGVIFLTGLGIYFMASFYSSIFFSNLSYGRNTQLRGYVLTDEQIVQAGNFFLENETFSPVQLSFDQLNKHKKSFIVILAKNNGHKQGWGTLKCTIGNESVEVSAMGLHPHMKESALWIIPIGNAILGNGLKQPQPLVEWKKLYVK